MKKIILLLAILLSACSQSWASIDGLVSTLGIKNSSNVHPIEVDKDGLVVFGATAAMKFPYATGSTTYTITAAQTGTTIVFNNGAGTAVSGAIFMLPTAVVGMQYTIVADVAKYFYLDCQTSDIINFSTATAGQRISNSGSAAAGDSITVFCATDGQWSIKNKVGTWAVGPAQN